LRAGAIYCTHFSSFEGQHFGEDDTRRPEPSPPIRNVHDLASRLEAQGLRLHFIRDAASVFFAGLT
jgi:hypothetical protein